MKKILYIFMIALFSQQGAWAQSGDKIEDAYSLYRAEKLHESAKLLNEVIGDSKNAENQKAWYFRGFVYKDIYVKEQRPDRASPARESAVESFVKTIQLTQEKDPHTLVPTTNMALKFLGDSYFNDASEIIDERNEQTVEDAKDYYLRYKELINMVYPDSSMKKKDVEFYLAMSTAHRRLYEKNRKANEFHLDRSHDYLKLVLEIDPENWDAYYSLSVSHYNKGAKNAERVAEAENIFDIYEIEAESIRSIEMALPFMIKAYEIDPSRIEGVHALKVIYFNLNQEGKSQEMEKVENSLKKD